MLDVNIKLEYILSPPVNSIVVDTVTRKLADTHQVVTCFDNNMTACRSRSSLMSQFSQEQINIRKLSRKEGNGHHWEAGTRGGGQRPTNKFNEKSESGL